MPIREKFLYGLIQLETAAWAASFTWVDRTADIVGGISYSLGGRPAPPGQSQVDVGNLTVTFRNAATVPVVGDAVRLRRYGTSEYGFTGYVQDVSQRIVFDDTVKLSTPVTLTTIRCADWVGYISQFNAVGAGTSSTTNDSDYRWDIRIGGLNKIVDATGSTNMIDSVSPYTVTGYFLGDTDLVDSFPNHLDLICNSNPRVYWYPNNVIPTNITTGRTSLISIRELTTAPSTGKTFTDLVGSSGQLHYTEIDLENSSQNVANTIVVNNRVRLHVVDVEVTRIGGFNEENYMVINNTPTVGVAIETTQEKTDSTSITTYGVRRSEFETNASLKPSTSVIYNFICNPSVEYSDDGYTRNNTNCVVRRRQPLDDANPFSSYSGTWAMRLRQTTASPNARILYSGGEADGIPVVAGTTYYFKWYAARGTVSRTDMRANLAIRWYDDSETLLSTSTGISATLTTANTWYLVSTAQTAPANAVRATVEMLFERSGGANITVGDRLWADGLSMAKSNIGTFFDGDYATTASNIYGWTGGLGSSPSFKTVNPVDDIAAGFLTRYSTTSMRVTRIRWNAQEDLTAISSLTVGKTISLIYKSTTTTYRIVGIDGNVDPSRYMIDYYLIKD